MSIVISMLIGSKLSTKDWVEKCIRSIVFNIGTTDFLLVLGISSHIGPDIVNCVKHLSLTNSKIIVTTDHCSTYAKFHNHVFLKYGPGSKWFLLSHDDIQLETKGLVHLVEQSVQSVLDKVGWITFTDTDYLNGHWAPSVCGGFHNDFLYENAWLRRKLHQFHLLDENYWKKGAGRSYLTTLAYDFPHSAVKCHGPMSHFFMIETKKLKEIGLCEDWSEVSLLIDEDWALAALKKGLFNVWIPQIKYLHCRGKNEHGTRAWPIILKKAKQVADLWEKKWGFRFKDISKETANKIKRMYGNTNIVWSMDKMSYDWEYLK